LFIALCTPPFRLGASVDGLLDMCMPFVRDWSRSLFHPWLETIFSTNEVAFAMVRSRKASPAAASMWPLDVGVSLF
jgi:hypothetical protein